MLADLHLEVKVALLADAKYYVRLHQRLEAGCLDLSGVGCWLQDVEDVMTRGVRLHRLRNLRCVVGHRDRRAGDTRPGRIGDRAAQKGRVRPLRPSAA